MRPTPMFRTITRALTLALTASVVTTLGPGAAPAHSLGILATITAQDAEMTYGDPVPRLSFDSTVDLLSDPLCSTTATSSSPVGTYPITCTGGKVLGGLLGGVLTHVAGTLTVKAREGVVSAHDAVMTQGHQLPALTSTVTGLLGGAQPTTPPTCTTQATSSSPAGVYEIVCSGAELLGHTFRYLSGSLRVLEPGDQTIVKVLQPEDLAMVFGEQVPTLTPPTGGLELEQLGSCSTAATASSPVGTYPIVCQGAQLTGYLFSYVPGVLRVDPAQVTLARNDASMTYGDPVPELEFTVADGSPAAPGSCTTTATSRSDVGEYPITCSLGSGNFRLASTERGTLTVLPRQLVIRAASRTLPVGATVPAPAFRAEGLLGGDKLITAPRCSVAGKVLRLGRFTQQCTDGSAGANYEVSTVPATVTVTKAGSALRITAPTKRRFRPSATLLRTSDQAPIAGQRVVFTQGRKVVCRTTTTTRGTATCKRRAKATRALTAWYPGNSQQEAVRSVLPAKRR